MTDERALPSRPDDDDRSTCDDDNDDSDHNDNNAQTFYGTLEYAIDPDTMVAVAYLRQERDITVNNGLATDANGSLLDVDRSTFFGAKWNDFESTTDDFIFELTHRFESGGFGRVVL